MTTQNQTSQTEQTPEPRRWKLSRRQFLIGLGAGGVLAVGAALGAPIALRETRIFLAQNLIMGGLPPANLPEMPTAWFEITPDNVTHMYLPKVEMGQGIHTAMAQIAADELEVDWQAMQVHQPDLAHGFDAELIFTFGSNSVIAIYQPLREAAAMMREMLRLEAAAQLGQPISQIKLENSQVIAGDEVRTFGEIVANKTDAWQLPETSPTLKPNSEFRYIGQPIQRVDLPAKVTGQATFGYDVRVPDMLYGAVARPPRFEATVRSANVGTAYDVPGVVQVVIEIENNFVGVAAESRLAARKALAQMEIEWQGGSTVSQAEIEEIVTVGDGGGVLIQNDGNVRGNIDSATQVTAEYRTPLAAHATLEPQAAMVEIKGDQITVHTSTQGPAIVQGFIADALDHDPAKINVIPTYLGAAFGRKGAHDVGVEAARLAAATDKPVHVGWLMPEEIQYGHKRPPTHHVLRGALDDTGRVIALDSQLASGDVAFQYPELLPAGDFTITLIGADALAAYGALILYNGIPNRRVGYHRTDIPVPTSFWRGLGLLANTFALESFMDEMAHTVGLDPIQFRLNQLDANDPINQRLRAVLERVAELSDWADPAPEGRARGVAACFMSSTAVAQVAEVSIENNRIRVHQVTCVADAGLIINPNGARAQVEGCIIMGLSSTLIEKMTVENGLIAQQNFDSYPLITMRDMPEITIDFIESADYPVGGMGEPAIGPVPAAVANAVFSLTGQRLRELPLKLA